MSDPVWDKVYELTQGYPAEFNTALVYDLVMSAWRMGLNIVRDPEAPQLYLDAMRAIGEASRPPDQALQMGLENSNRR